MEHDLRSVSALTAYHWVYSENVKPWLVADLLSCSRTRCRGRWRAATKIWCKISTVSPTPMGAKARRSARRAPCAPACKTAQHRKQIFQSGLHKFIDDFVEDNNQLGTAIAQQYLM